MENANQKSLKPKKTFWKHLAQEIKYNFSLDTRSLALFRVLVSLILIVDFIFTRMPWFTLFYSNKGLLPFWAFWNKGSFQSSVSSLNFVSPLLVYQWALFILAIIFFLMLLVGYKTKWALLGSWILLVSFQSRNFLILNSGDILLGMLLFWALRLPLGKYFSIDGALRDQKEKPVFSVNSVVFILQILLVYYFTYILKSHEVWKTNQGVYYALMLENFRTVWGDILLQYPSLMRMLSFITYYVVENLIFFLFVFFGFLWRVKTVLILCMCLFHLSLGFFLHLGLFSYICMAGWLALLPPEFWEKISCFPNKKKVLKVYYDGHCSFCRKTVFLIKTFLILQKVSVFTIQSDEQALSESEKRNSWVVFDPETKWHGRFQAFRVLLSHSALFFYLAPLLRTKWISCAGDWLYKKTAKNRRKLGYFIPALKASEKSHQRRTFLSVGLAVFFFICFLYVLAWNIRTVNFKYYGQYMSKQWNGFGAFFHLYQYWNMFAPKPMDTTGWIILSAVTKDTEEKIDLWRKGKPLDMEKPHRYDTTFPVFRFRKMLENLVYKHKKYSKYYLQYLCDQWNTKKTSRAVKHIELIYMKQKVPPPGEEFTAPKKISIRKKTCRL